jgi:putative redox protein
MKTIQRQVSATLSGPPYATQLSTRGLEWTADEPADHGGADKGASPHEMLLGGLAACTAITMRMYADRKGWAVGAITVRVSLDRQQEGREVESHIHLEVELPRDLPQDQRERLLQIAQACPVHRTLESPLHLSASLAS